MAPQPPTGMAGLYGGVGPTAYVNNLYAPQEQALARQQQARAGTLQSLVQSILANLSRPQPDVYGAAAHDAVSAANGAAQTLQRVNPNASTQAMLQAIGAPQSQQDQVGAQNANTFTGGAALDQYVGGALPAGVFAQDQAARQTYLHSLPATVGLAAIQGLGHLNLMSSQENSQLSSQKTQAQHNALTDLANYVQKNQALKAQAQKTAWDERFKVGQANEHVDEFNARQKMSLTRLQYQQSNADRTYGLSYDRYVLAEKKAAKAQANGGLTPYQKNTVTTKAEKDAENFYYGVAATTRANGTVSKAAVQPLTYQQAIRTLVNRYPVLGASGAIKLANSLYKPGEGGRPSGPTDQSAPALYGPSQGQAQKGSVVATASKFLGVPYQYGGNNPKTGIDCSRFVQLVYAQHGINLPRTTYAQVKLGQPVTLQQLQAGDVIFTEPGKNGPNHEGLYVGNGMVQESPHHGDVNKLIPLSDFLSGGFVAARRYG